MTKPKKTTGKSPRKAPKKKIPVATEIDMTNVTPVSEKLRDRAVRIVVQLAGVDDREARHLLDRNGDSVAAAVREAHSTR